MDVVEQFNPEKIIKDVEKKELGELGERIDEMSNTELIEFMIDTQVCNTLAKFIMKRRNIDLR